MRNLKLLLLILLIAAPSAPRVRADGGPIPMCNPDKNCDKGTGKPVPQPTTCPKGTTCT